MKIVTFLRKNRDLPKNGLLIFFGNGLLLLLLFSTKSSTISMNCFRNVSHGNRVKTNTLEIFGDFAFVFASLFMFLHFCSLFPFFFHFWKFSFFLFSFFVLLFYFFYFVFLHFCIF